MVASFAEAWIEIAIALITFTVTPSPPSRRRGLKFRSYRASLEAQVASFAEAWIEISMNRTRPKQIVVASFAEAWIEISWLSLNNLPHIVASFAEAWIEIQTLKGRAKGKKSPPSRRRGLKY